MRIVASPAAAGALHEYGIDVVGVLGSAERMGGTANPALGLLDPDGLVSLGDTAGEMSMEQLAALDPDVVITESWGEDDSFGMEPDQREQVASQIAPVVRLRVDGREMPDVLDRFGELAEAIGTARGTGDAVATARAEGRTELDAARGRLADAAAKQDLAVLAASGSPEQLYVARPAGYADLTYFRDAGVDVVEPTSPVGSEPSGAQPGATGGGQPAAARRRLGPMSTTIPDTHLSLLEAPIATFATIGPDGRPQQSLVWFLVEDGQIKVSLNTSRQKTKNLLERPVADVLIADPSGYRYLEVRGDVTIEPDDDYEFASRVGAKYGGQDMREMDGEGESRVVVTIEASRVNAVAMG